MRYSLYAGHLFYPEGGADDFVQFVGTIDEAKSIASSGDYEWAQIVHHDTMTTVLEGDKHPFIKGSDWEWTNVHWVLDMRSENEEL